MIRVSLICNTSAAFPLIQWMHEQGCLASVGILDQPSELFDDIHTIASQLNVQLQIFSKDHITTQLVDWQAEVKADIILVLGFPYKIRKRALETVSLGYFNIHFGKLPEYGGSFPVFWQIYRGEQEAVLTIHKMDESFDAGPVAIEIPFEINESQTFGMVEANYSFVTVNGVFQLLGNILNNSMVLREQAQNDSDYFPKPTLKDLIINWRKMRADEIVRLVKATNPWNKGAIARINGLDIKVLEAKITAGSFGNAGEVVRVSLDGLEVSCVDNTAILIKIIYASYGYLDGENMGILGIQPGDHFDQLI